MNKIAVGVLELSSIAKGIQSMDVMLKASKIDVIISRTICPGKYLMVVSGDIGEVSEAISKGVKNSGKYMLNELVLPAVHKDVLSALNGKTKSVNPNKPIGVIEFSCITSGILACDTALKSANVKILNFKAGMFLGGKSYFIITGDTSSIQEAFNAVKLRVNKNKIINYTIISSPDAELTKYLLN